MTMLRIIAPVVYLMIAVVTARRVWRQVGGDSVPDMFGSGYLGLAWPVYWVLEAARWRQERKER